MRVGGGGQPPTYCNPTHGSRQTRDGDTGSNKRGYIQLCTPVLLGITGVNTTYGRVFLARLLYLKKHIMLYYDGVLRTRCIALRTVLHLPPEKHNFGPRTTHNPLNW